MNLEPQITTQPTHHSLPGTVDTLRGNPIVTAAEQPEQAYGGTLPTECSAG